MPPTPVVPEYDVVGRGHDDEPGARELAATSRAPSSGVSASASPDKTSAGTSGSGPGRPGGATLGQGSHRRVDPYSRATSASNGA